MKKITLPFMLLLMTIGLHAQNFYNFSVLQQPYSDLQNSTSLNNGLIWDYDSFGPVTIPFTFSFGGEVVNRFIFDDDYFAFVTPSGNINEDEGVFYVFTSAAFLQDRTYNTGVSSSPISYKTEGVTGNRILKIEVKNAGLEEASELGFSADHFFINTQIWLYESDNTIEFRYGEHNITDITYINAGDPAPLAGIEYSNGDGFVIYGQSANPTYLEFDLETPDDFPSDSFPANGTVYRMTPAALVGLTEFLPLQLNMYPNPASTILNLESGNMPISEYAIYNVAGKLIKTAKVTESTNVQVNVAPLANGLYFIKVNNHFSKFVKNN